MKIRIKGNSLRLRVSQSEVEEFKKKGRVRDRIFFGKSRLVYTLQAEDTSKVNADFNQHCITVSVPHKIAEKWTETDQVGFEEYQPIADDEKLYLLVEKDFQCLIPRKEDESDLFENPRR